MKRRSRMACACGDPVGGRQGGGSGGPSPGLQPSDQPLGAGNSDPTTPFPEADAGLGSQAQRLPCGMDYSSTATTTTATACSNLCRNLNRRQQGLRHRICILTPRTRHTTISILVLHLSSFNNIKGGRDESCCFRSDATMGGLTVVKTTGGNLRPEWRVQDTPSIVEGGVRGRAAAGAGKARARATRRQPETGGWSGEPVPGGSVGGGGVAVRQQQPAGVLRKVVEVVPELGLPAPPPLPLLLQPTDGCHEGHHLGHRGAPAGDRSR